MVLRKAGDAPEHKTIVVSVLGLLSLASCQSQVCNRCPLRGHHRRRHRRRQGCCRHHRRRDRCRCCYVVLVIVVAVVTDVVLLLVLFVLVLLLFLFLVLVLNIIQCHHPLATTPKISGSAFEIYDHGATNGGVRSWFKHSSLASMDGTSRNMPDPAAESSA